MQNTMAQGYVLESVESIVLFTLLALFVNLYANSRRFFIIPYPLLHKKKASPKLIHVVSCFGIYVGVSLFFAHSAAYLIRLFWYYVFGYSAAPLSVLSILQLTTSLLTIFFLFWYVKKQNTEMMQRVWKDYSLPTASSKVKDFFFGAFVWVLGFPLVAAVGQLCDLITYLIFGMQPYEQVAVRYLKMTLGSIPMLFVALFSILIAAPIIEEFLFRGMLQSWLKTHLGTKAAILTSSFAFALFHVAASQGLGNISLVISLFSFACFLGFVYEKRGSLIASIGLHMTFNTISTFRILFFSES